MDKQIIETGKEIGQEISEKTNAFFDFFREIDYYFQGKRSKIFIYGAFTIVIFAPIIDYLILPRRLSLTSVATYLYLFFFLISLIAWAGRFRDEKNKWSFKRFKERIKLSFTIIKDTIQEIKQKDRNSQLFILGLWIFIAGFIIKALQNISEIFRMPFQNIIGVKMGLLRTFESYTALGFVLIFIGITILLYLHFSKCINLLELFSKKSEKPHLIQLNLQNDYVVNTKNKEQIRNIIISNPDPIFRSTVNTLLDWSPKTRHLEEDYEIDLDKFLSRRLRKEKISVDTQYTFKTGRETGRVDFSINDSLFIELKRKIKSTELDRASGQILKYQRILENTTTPLILLIVDTEYESIKNRLSEFIKDYNNKHIQKLLAVIVEPK